jgi:DNA-binding transcriptional MerR regulator
MGKNEITLREAALVLEINKSRLHYYVSIGLLTPDSEISGIYLFDKKKLLKDIKTIDQLRKKAYTLEEIKTLLPNFDKKK